MNDQTAIWALGVAFTGAGIGGFVILGLLAWCWWADRRKCDHERMRTVNADGWCLVCGKEV